MQRSQRKRCAPSWLKEKPYLKVRFTQDGITSKVTESCKLKLEEKGCLLTGSLSNYSFGIGQKVWKTVNKKEKTYFEEEIIEMWDDATIAEENLPISNEEDGIAEDVPSDDKEEVTPSPEKRSKRVKKTAKRRLEKQANDKDEEAKAAKRLANKEKAMEEKTRQEDNLSQSKELLEISDELATDMLYDFMKQIISHLDGIEKKVHANQQNLERILRKIEKPKDHSLPVQVFLGKSDNTENNRPGSPCLLKKSCLDPTICSTPKANSKTNESPASSCSKLDTGNYSFDGDDVNVTESSSPNAEQTAEILPEEISNGSSPEEINDLVIIGDPKYNIKTDRECFENNVKHSSSASALALNLLDNLVPKEVQRISNIKGVLGKAPLDPRIWQLLKVYAWLRSLQFL
ncbi:uncharacterized protein [Montipora capricornis]|uniref:uncharacterized protein n=1 Tax=Montipora capricornis TaxID=246305 RepID=UPI0035F1D32C